MRQLLPHPIDDVEPYDAYGTGDRPVVRMNMVASADGGVVDKDGRSGTIGGVGDREIFRSLRALADVIVVGAGTARTEGYGPHRPPAHLRERRLDDGRPKPAAIAVVTRSLDLDWSAPLFTEALNPTLIITTARADAERRRRAASAGTVVEAGDEEVRPTAVVEALRRLGHEQVLIEGGPSLNRAWLDAGVVDELCLTIAPALLGETGARLAGDVTGRVELSLLGVLHDDEDELYLRYGVSR
jgi:riboflavin biosynthesis pyrimidine reductase